MSDNNLFGIMLITLGMSLTIIGVTGIVTTKSEHEHRMELIEEARAIYELKKDIEFDQTVKHLNYVTDSLNAEIESELNK